MRHLVQLAVNSHNNVSCSEPAVVYVVFVCPPSTAFISPRNSGWIGWWSPELLVALALELLMFWELLDDEKGAGNDDCNTKKMMKLYPFIT